jgi:F-type H+-transporting ATPase subunit a
MVWSPLEQFTIIRILPIRFGNFDLSFTNSSFYLFMATGFCILLFYFVTKDGGMIRPSPWQVFVESIWSFTTNLVKEQIGREGCKYVPFIFSTFLFLLCTNLIGMIPYSFTATSHLICTFALSFSLFIGITIIGFQYHGLHFFSFLYPPGAPIILAPLLVVLELVSYSFRAVSLAVRLFANMMAGHTLVKILSAFGWTMLQSKGVPLLSIASIIPFIIVFALMGLEIAVACLQAYVFTILTCIYLNDAINLH